MLLTCFYDVLRRYLRSYLIAKPVYISLKAIACGYCFLVLRFGKLRIVLPLLIQLPESDD